MQLIFLGRLIMFNNKKQFGFIALSCVLGALLGLVLPGMTLAGVTCTVRVSR